MNTKGRTCRWTFLRTELQRRSAHPEQECSHASRMRSELRGARLSNHASTSARSSLSSYSWHTNRPPRSRRPRHDLKSQHTLSLCRLLFRGGRGATDQSRLINAESNVRLLTTLARAHRTTDFRDVSPLPLCSAVTLCHVSARCVTDVLNNNRNQCAVQARANARRVKERNVSLVRCGRNLYEGEIYTRENVSFKHSEKGFADPSRILNVISKMYVLWCSLGNCLERVKFIKQEHFSNIYGKI